MVVRETEDGHVSPAVEVGLLGALRLRVDGAEVAVPGERRRALLALLTVAGRHGMGIGRLVDGCGATICRGNRLPHCTIWCPGCDAISADTPICWNDAPTATGSGCPSSM